MEESKLELGDRLLNHSVSVLDWGGINQDEISPRNNGITDPSTP
jgi:hypothetical protein